MTCYRPLKAHKSSVGLLMLKDQRRVYDALGRGVDVLSLPCGKCFGCRKERAALWTLRIMHEASLHDENGFLTLTYDDENLPYGVVPTLCKRDLQLLHKRARKSASYRYFGVGEYGGNTARPHYHLCTFGWLPKRTAQVTARTWQSDELDALWKLGNCTVGEVTSASAAYVAGYVTKKLACQEDYVRDGRAPVFACMSNGIGKGWFEKYHSDLDKGYIVFNGRKTRIPRYYREKKGVMDADWYLLARLEARQFRRDLDLEESGCERLAVKEQCAAAKAAFFGSSSREPSEVR